MTEATVVTSENLQQFQMARLFPDGRVEDATITDPKPNADAPPAGEQVVEPPKTEEEPKKKGNPKIEQRFSELTEARRKAEERAEQAEKRAKELEEKLNPPQKDPLVEKIGPKPKKEDYTDPFDYAADLSEWSAKHAVQEKEVEDAKLAKERESAKVVESWQKRLREVKAEIPDWEETIQSSDVSVSDQVRDAIIESEVGPKILYHLASHPELAEKIRGLTVTGALREIGKMEARLEKAEETKPEPKVEMKPKAEMITPIKAKSVPDVRVNSAGEYTGSYAQWKADRKAGRI